MLPIPMQTLAVKSENTRVVPKHLILFSLSPCYTITETELQNVFQGIINNDSSLLKLTIAFHWFYKTGY